MKSFSGLVISVIILMIVLLITFSVGQFADKSPIFVSGTLIIEEELAQKAHGIRTVFIIIYDDESNAPLPYAAIRKVLDQDPSGTFLDFLLTKDNMQIMNQSQAGPPKKIRIKARLDRGGTAGADEPGDIVGELSGVDIGTEGVRIHMNRYVS